MNPSRERISTALACVDFTHRSAAAVSETPKASLLSLNCMTYYHYCEIDAATVQGLERANSKRQFFETRIRGSGADGPFDCRTHPIPKKYRQ